MAILLRNAAGVGVCPSEETNGRRRPGVVSDARTGSVLRRALNERPVRYLELRWTDAAEGERHLLRQAWRASGGGVLLVDYTPTGETNDTNKVTGCFVPGSYRETQTGRNKFLLGVDLEERL